MLIPIESKSNIKNVNGDEENSKHYFGEAGISTKYENIYAYKFLS